MDYLKKIPLFIFHVFNFNALNFHALLRVGKYFNTDNFPNYFIKFGSKIVLT